MDKKMKLYELNQEISAVFEKYTNKETGEIDEEAFHQLEVLNQEFTEKAENLVKWIQDLKGDIEKAKAEEKRIATLRKSREKKIENIQKYLALSLKNANKEKLDLGFAKLSFRSSKSVSILDENIIPDEFIKTERKPLKNEIKKFLETQKECKWAKLETKKNLTIK